MSKPNFLIFNPDQLRADCVGAFGNPVVQTPNIDALAANGTIFTNAFAQHSVCSPSRASFLTGWYPHVMGHRTLTSLLKPHEPNLLKLLKDDGYNVCWAGRRGDTFAPGMTEESTNFHGFKVFPEMLFGPSPYDENHKFARAFYHGRRKGDGPFLDLDEANIQTAEQWLAEKPEGPWALFIALIFPHPPFEVEEPWYSLHNRADMPDRAQADLTRKPAFMSAIRESYGTDRLSEDDWREIMATYYGMISRVDDQLGRVLKAIDDAGERENTVTLFFTDHGEYLGDYGLVEKWWAGLDDCLLRNPLIVSAPRYARGQVCDEMVELIDIVPTVYELAEIECGYTHFGKSLEPLLEDASLPHKEAAFSEGGFNEDELHLLDRPGFPYDLKGELQRADPVFLGKAVSVRTKQWTYIYRRLESDELYDRLADPRETVNLIDDAEHSEIALQLRNKIFEWLVDTSDVIPWEEDPRFPDR
jgi:arylsulfatase A-like enzyme